MRFEKIQLFFECEVELVNLSPIILNTPKIFRSLGWRYKVGPMISRINSVITKKIKNSTYDIVWVDKGVFIKPEIIQQLRSKTKKLIHLTPDPAFLYHKSRFFNKSVKFYDYCITTKSFEIDLYNKSGAQHCIYLTQGFDKEIHRPLMEFDEKKYEVCFIGHYEKERAELIQLLLDNDIEVVIAGIKWEGFVKKNTHNKLKYFGPHLAGEDYARLINESRIGLGLLSKWIPEKHTTRTFEIPACKTCLVTESNNEIRDFFLDTECIEFSDSEDCLRKVQLYLATPDKIKELSELGFNRVIMDRRDYESQMFDLCNRLFSVS
jgi:spore maturation protein CgeB